MPKADFGLAFLFTICAIGILVFIKSMVIVAKEFIKLYKEERKLNKKNDVN